MDGGKGLGGGEGNLLSAVHWSTFEHVVGHPVVAVMVCVGLKVQGSAAGVVWALATARQATNARMDFIFRKLVCVYVCVCIGRFKVRTW